MVSEEDDDGMDQLASQTAKRTDAELSVKELAVLQKTDSAKLLALRPQVSDPGAFDALMVAVNQATKSNESVADLKNRVSQLGAGAAATVKEILQIASRLPL